MQVIGLTGFAGSGKSTVAEYLVKEHGFTRLSFAAPLKKMLRTLNPIMPDSRPGHDIHLDQVIALFDGDETKIKESYYGKEYRRLLQVLGTDCIRAVDPDFWVKAAIMQMVGQDGKYVFDDCRFPNEAAVISGYNPAGVWNIERPGIHAVNGHASEQWAGKMNERIWLFNGSDIEGLHDQIDAALDLAFGAAL